MSGSDATMNAVALLRNAVGLLRVSTEEQGRSGLGIEAQMSRIEEYCSRKGLTLLSAFREHVSGAASLDSRLGLLAAMDAAKATDAALVVATRDRLSRDPLISMLVEKEVKVLTADGLGEGDDPSACFQRRVMDAVAELERKLISARTKAALEAKKRRGEPVGRAPYGFRYQDGELVEDVQNYRILGRILEMKEAGHGVRNIAAHLNDVGYLSPQGGPWHKTSVYRIVKRAEELCA